MAYKVMITERAEELRNQCLYHMLFQLKNNSAAKHLLDELDKLHVRLEENPYQFADCRDPFLKSKGYKEAIISGMNYIVIFLVKNQIVTVLGIFHQLEDYRNKM